MKNDLDQSEFWQNRAGTKIRIEDMDYAYRANCAVFLLKNARKLEDAHSWVYLTCPDDGPWEIFNERDPEDFIRSTELFKSLVDEINISSQLEGELVFSEEVKDLPPTRALIPEFRRTATFDSDGWKLVSESVSYYKVSGKGVATPVDLLWEIDRVRARVPGEVLGTVYGYGLENRGFLWRARAPKFELEMGTVSYA